MIYSQSPVQFNRCLQSIFDQSLPQHYTV